MPINYDPTGPFPGRSTCWSCGQTVRGDTARHAEPDVELARAPGSVRPDHRPRGGEHLVPGVNSRPVPQAELCWCCSEPGERITGNSWMRRCETCAVEWSAFPANVVA